MFELYIESNEAYLEVSFPEFGHTVIYSDNINHALKSQYIFPPIQLAQYNATLSSSNASDNLFSRITSA